MNEIGEIIPVEEILASPDLEIEYQKAKQLAERFVLAIDEMLTGQPGPKVSEIIHSNVEKVLREYYDGKPEGLDLSAESRLQLLQNTCIEFEEFLKLPRTPAGFFEGQVIIDQYLHDTKRSETQSPLRQMTTNELADGQMAIMNEINLSDYENATTDTPRALLQLMQLLQDPMMLATAKNSHKLEVLEPGIGEGRIAIPLLLLGHQVHGIELSPRTTERMRQRIADTVSKLENDETDRYLGQINEAFAANGLNFQEIVANNKDNLNNGLQISQGDFFQPKSFEGIEDESIDICPIMWHTFGFAGDRETELILLKNIYNKLRPGGLLVIEMPDPNFGPYAEAIDKFDQAEQERANSDHHYKRYPRGTIIDAPSASNNSPTSGDAETKAVRYFPDHTELIETLQEADFMYENTYQYFVGQKNASDKETLVIKEGLIVARKPLAKDQWTQFVNSVN